MEEVDLEDGDAIQLQPLGASSASSSGAHNAAKHKKRIGPQDKGEIAAFPLINEDGDSIVVGGARGGAGGAEGRGGKIMQCVVNVGVVGFAAVAAVFIVGLFFFIYTLDPKETVNNTPTPTTHGTCTVCAYYCTTTTPQPLYHNHTMLTIYF